MSEIDALRERLEAAVRGRCAVSAPAVAQVCTAYLEHAAAYYQRRPGSSELTNCREALAPVVELYGSTPAESFGAVELQAVRLLMVERGLARSTINARVGRIRRCWRWAIAQGWLPPACAGALAAVEPLRRGRSAAPEPKRVTPVSWPVVAATIARVSPAVAVMVHVQWWTGCRPGEVCGMRADEIDATAVPWRWTPSAHKCAWRGQERVIWIGPRAIERLHGWMACCGPWVFAYRESSFYTAIRRGCLRAGVQHWSPNQLRHAAATRIRAELGIEAARVVLGHADADTTSIYAERDVEVGREAALRLG